MASTSIGTAYVTVEPKMSGSTGTIIGNALGSNAVGGMAGKALGGAMSGGIMAGLAGIAGKVLPAIGVAEAAKGVGDIMSSSLDTYAGFSAIMSEVKAISGADDVGFERMTEAAKELGSTTKFTAAEAGEALKYMAMAGWNVDQMLGDGELSASALAATLNLAAASGQDLGTTSDIVTDAMSALGISAEGAGHFTDILAAASSSANTNVGLMGETFKYVASVAGTAGYSAEELAYNIALMADQGTKGSMAGTALRSIITRLISPTGDAAKAMDALGLSATRQDGSLKGMNELLDECRIAFQELTPAQQEQMASTIVGQEAMTGFLNIMNASPETMERVSAAIGDCDGAAQEMASTMQDNLQGDVTALDSAFDGLKIRIGEDLAPIARDFVQWTTNTFVPALGDIVGVFESIGGAIAGAIGWLESFIKKSEEANLTAAQSNYSNFGSIMSSDSMAGVGSGGIIVSGAGYYDPSTGNYVALASGGVTTGPVNALVGEAGTEMVLPLNSGAIDPFTDKIAERLQGGQSIVVNIDGARVNDGAYINAAVGNFLFELNRMGAI